MDKCDEQVNFRIVLFQPEIPANTGNIGRLCVGANCSLHIIKPMRFFINDKTLKRAGLDYWDKLPFYLHETLEEFLERFKPTTCYYCTTKTKRRYSEQKFNVGDAFVFGPESRGIPEDILFTHPKQCLTIPMSDKIRSLNLANSVGIILYEALRQIDFCLA